MAANSPNVENSFNPDTRVFVYCPLGGDVKRKGMTSDK